MSGLYIRCLNVFRYINGFLRLNPYKLVSPLVLIIVSTVEVTEDTQKYEIFSVHLPIYTAATSVKAMYAV